MYKTCRWLMIGRRQVNIDIRFQSLLFSLETAGSGHRSHVACLKNECLRCDKYGNCCGPPHLKHKEGESVRALTTLPVFNHFFIKGIKNNAVNYLLYKNFDLCFNFVFEIYTERCQFFIHTTRTMWNMLINFI